MCPGDLLFYSTFIRASAPSRGGLSLDPRLNDLISCHAQIRFLPLMRLTLDEVNFADTLTDSENQEQVRASVSV